MLKENQRVVDLSNVDTNAKAFILGVQCGFQFGNKSIDYLEHGILRVEKDWRYSDYNIFKDFVEREFDATVKSYDNERIKNGFIERDVSSNDSRRKILTLTEKSKEILNHMDLVFEATDNQLQEGMSDEEKMTFRLLLGIAHNNINV